MRFITRLVFYECTRVIILFYFYDKNEPSVYGSHTGLVRHEQIDDVSTIL